MKRKNSFPVFWPLILTAILGFSFSFQPAQAAEEIRIGVLAPTTGSLAQSGIDAVRGFELFWETVGNKAAGRPIKLIVADTGCNPDNAMNLTRRLITKDNVHFIVGPLCGHEGKPVAQVSGETGVPLLMTPAAPDDMTKWNRVPTVIRTSFSASQEAHPFGEFVFKELRFRNVAFIGQDYTYGQEKTLGAVATFTKLGGKVSKLIWTPIGTKDYGPLLAGIPSGTDGVVVTVVGADRLRLFEQWFDFGYDKKYKVAGNCWMQLDALRQMDDRAVGMISNAIHYAQGIDSPENKAFIDAFAKKYKELPSYFAECNYTTGIWAKTAIEAIKGKVEDRKAFLEAVRKAKIKSPRGPVSLDKYDNPIHNAYITKVAKIKHPVLGDVKINVPVKTYENVSQFWTWAPEEFLAKGPYKR